MTQPSGWYDDPQDSSRLRYWDGILWSDHTVPKQSPTAAASTIGRAVDPYAPTPSDTPGGRPAGPPVSPYAGPPGQSPYSAPPGYGYGAAPTMPWRPAGPRTAEGTPLAEWWQRLLASLIDGLIQSLLTFALAFPWLRDFFTWYIGYVDDLASTTTTTAPDFNSLMEDMSAQMLRFIIPLTLISLAVMVLYNVVFLVRWGATPGKMILGIRVRRVGRPGPLRLVEALRRVALPAGLSLLGAVPLVSYLASPVQLLDYLWLLWDPRRQCLHDKVADTVVEQRPKFGR